jgi:hypothetical protein
MIIEPFSCLLTLEASSPILYKYRDREEFLLLVLLFGVAVQWPTRRLLKFNCTELFARGRANEIRVTACIKFIT